MTNFQTLFENCGKFYLPGREPTGNPLAPITPPSFDPQPTDPGDELPILPTDPPGGGGNFLYKCVEFTTAVCPPPFENVERIRTKQCQICVDAFGNPITSLITSPQGYPECEYTSPTCDDPGAPPCVTMLFPCPGIPKKYKCVRKEIPCPTGSLPEIQQVVRECEECPDPALGFPSDPECVYNTPDCSEAIAGRPPCISDPPNLCISKPTDPGGGGGGSVAAFKCVTTEQVCPPGSLNAGSRIRVESRVCESCNKGQPQQPPTQTSPGKIFNGVVLAPAIRKSESLCQYNSPTACLGACPPVVGGGASTSQTQLQSFCNEEPQNVSVNNPGLEEDGVATPSPAQSVSLPSQQLLETQERNAVRINPNKQLIQEDFNELKNRESVQKFYHPEYNLFNLKTDRSVRFVANTSYLNIFKTEVDASISKAFSLQKSNSTWSEKDILNITLEKIEKSLNSDLLTSFKIIRYPGGEVVGLNVFLNMVRKHLLTGTVSQIDSDFYISIAKAQLQQAFTLLDSASNNEYASRYSVKYISENGQPLNDLGSSIAQQTQINRGRFLNEDLNITFPIETLLSSTKTLAMPNEGVPLETLASYTSITPESIGSPNLLNIGDGGGYYVNLSSMTGEVPLNTDNLVNNSYYLPDFKKSKILSLNGKSFISKITASSLSNQHEFVSGDAGASAFEPMYFGINLASVSSSYDENPLIEKYTATYSRITDESQIAKHVNNNAQSISEFRIGYDDPLYRYILDTSSFQIEQEDITVYGFKEGYSSINFNFPKNIPFAVVILPVAGSKFNPLNGQSNLISYDKDVLVRSLSFKPSLNNFIDGRGGNNLKTYNLYNEDGSTRIGLVEPESVQSFGYKYNPLDYVNTLYDGSTYTSSINAVSSFGISYLLTEVLDYISETTNAKLITWFDLFRRMPFNRFAELTYTAPAGIYHKIKNGFRNDIRVDYLLKGLGDQQSLLLPDDSRTIIQKEDRRDISRKLELSPRNEF